MVEFWIGYLSVGFFWALFAHRMDVLTHNNTALIRSVLFVINWAGCILSIIVAIINAPMLCNRLIKKQD